jgi:hypothetical protein
MVYDPSEYETEQFGAGKPAMPPEYVGKHEAGSETPPAYSPGTEDIESFLTGVDEPFTAEDIAEDKPFTIEDIGEDKE